MCGTRRTRSSRTQSSWLAGYRWLLSIYSAVLRLRLRLRPALLPAALHGGQSVAHVRQGRGAGRGDAGRPAGGRPAGRAKLRREAGLTDAARQVGEVAAPAGVPAWVTAVGRAVVPAAGAEAAALIGAGEAVIAARAAVGAAAVRSAAVRAVVAASGGGPAEVGVRLLVAGLGRSGSVLFRAVHRGEDIERRPRRRGRPADRHPGHHRNVVRSVPSPPAALGPVPRRERRGRRARRERRGR